MKAENQNQLKMCIDVPKIDNMHADGDFHFSKFRSRLTGHNVDRNSMEDKNFRYSVRYARGY